MKAVEKLSAIVIGIFVMVQPLSSQDVGINTVPDASAILDVVSSNKGLLIPRMSKADRDLIASPANALLIYQTDESPGFYYFDNASATWKILAGLASKIEDADGDTQLQTEKNNDEDIIRVDIAGTEKLNLSSSGAVNAAKLQIVNTQDNISVGDSTASGFTTASGNISVGMGALNSNVTGPDNLVIGYKAANLLTAGSALAIGNEAMKGNLNNGYNITAIGHKAYAGGTSSDYSVIIGSETPVTSSQQPNVFVGRANSGSLTNGGSVVSVGEEALFNGTATDNNTAIGYKAMFNNLGNDKGLAIGALSGNRGDHTLSIGYRSLQSNTLDYSMSIGSQSGWQNTTGKDNLGVGFSTLYDMVTGNDNVAVGARALEANTLSRNTALGANALKDNTGADNTAIGFNAMSSPNDTSSCGVAVGANALSLNLPGSNNTLVGFNANVANGVSNAVVIGANAFASSSNSIVLGSVQGINGAANTVQVGIGTTAPHASAAFDVTSTSRGFAMPLMTSTTWQGISNPAEGLMVFDIGNRAPFYFNGTSWVNVKENFPLVSFGASTGQSYVYRSGGYQLGVPNSIASLNPFFTKASVESTANNDQFRVKLHIGGNIYDDKFIMRENSFGQLLMEVTNNRKNVYISQIEEFLGEENVVSDIFSDASQGSFNTAIGINQLRPGSGYRNIALGSNNLNSAIDEENNIAIGYRAAMNMTGDEHLAIGYRTSRANPTINTSGTLAIGAHATVAANLSRASAIGYRSVVNCSDCMTLGSIPGKNGAIWQTEVGIGTDNPEHPLHVYGTSSASNPQILLEEASDVPVRIIFHDLVTDGSWHILGDPHPNLFTSLMAFHFNGSEKMSIRGDGQAFIQGNLSQNSDGRFKTDFQPFTNALDKLKGIRAFQYHWADPNRSQDLQTGLMAQDVQQTLPQLVSENDEGFLSVNYPVMNAVLLTALKELKTKQEENDLRMGEQKKKIEELRERIRLKKQALITTGSLTSKSPQP